MTRFVEIGLLLLLVIGLSYSSVIFKLRLLEFNNPSGKDWDGNCCDLCYIPNEECDTSLQICLARGDQQFSSGAADTSSCTYYVHTTGEHTNVDNIDLSRFIPEIEQVIQDYQGSLQLRVYAKDNDEYPLPDDRIDVHIVRFSGQPDVYARRVWRTATSSGERPSRKTSLQYEYQLYCPHRYYGPQCTTRCVPQHSDSAGHYNCDLTTGSKICHSGWIGEDCRTREDDCYHHACENEAVCVDGNGMYDCVCTQGYTGTYCESNIDECNSDPCLHGNCTDLDNSYVCHCELGYVGQQCQDHVCANITCMNGGVCDDYGSCLCPSHTTGELCELSGRHFSPDVCSSQPCLHGGTCMAGSRQEEEEEELFGQGGRGYTCVCAEQYTGLFCEKEVQDVTAALPSPSKDDKSQIAVSGWMIGVFTGGVLLLIIIISIIIYAHVTKPCNRKPGADNLFPRVHQASITSRETINLDTVSISCAACTSIYLTASEAQRANVQPLRHGAQPNARSAMDEEHMSDCNPYDNNVPHAQICNVCQCNISRRQPITESMYRNVNQSISNEYMNSTTQSEFAADNFNKIEVQASCISSIHVGDNALYTNDNVHVSLGALENFHVPTANRSNNYHNSPPETFADDNKVCVGNDEHHHNGSDTCKGVLENRPQVTDMNQYAEIEGDVENFTSTHNHNNECNQDPAAAIDKGKSFIKETIITNSDSGSATYTAVKANNGTRAASRDVVGTGSVGVATSLTTTGTTTATENYADTVNNSTVTTPSTNSDTAGAGRCTAKASDTGTGSYVNDPAVILRCSKQKNIVKYPEIPRISETEI